jgi:hypothetical protein
MNVILLLLLCSLSFAADVTVHPSLKAVQKKKPTVKPPTPKFIEEEDKPGEIYCGREKDRSKTDPCQCQKRFGAFVRQYVEFCNSSSDPKCLEKTPGCEEMQMPSTHDIDENDFTGKSVYEDKLGPYCKRYCNMKNCHCCRS